MIEKVFLNGRFLPKNKAFITPDDRGFNFADGIYEVVKYYAGKPFRWNDHLKRLERSLAETAIHFDSLDKLEEICLELIKKNHLTSKHSGIYLQITRGAYRRMHNFPENLVPTVYASAFELPAMKEKLEKGIKVITREDIRWLRCDIKSVSLLPNTLLFQQAVESGADECILIRDSSVTEASHSSVCGVKNGKVVTHPLSNLILPGITRKVVAEICSENKIEFQETPINEIDLFNLDEIFISGTGSEILPVIQVNESPVGNGKPGQLTRFIQQKFFERTYRDIAFEDCWWSWTYIR